jgi:hypothetical protein
MPIPVSTRSESSLLVGSMIRVNTGSRNTSSPPVASAKPSPSKRGTTRPTGVPSATTRCNGPEEAAASRPRSNSP